VHRDVDRACAVLAGLQDHPLPSYDGEPVAAPPISDSSYDAARALFADAGIAFPAARTVRSRDELMTAMDTIGFPLVLKALGQSHKSDGGGVVLGVPDAPTAVAAYEDLVGRLAPPAVSVEEMAHLGQGVELIVGCVRDRTFGPVVMVGIGGVFAEVLADTALAIAPVSEAAARQLLLSLRGAPLLLGARGRDPVDLHALSALVSRVSHLAAAHPELVELELNPVLAGSSAAVALDARVVLGQSSTSRR
jgi:succinyl-CoA synthetase beta subunit